LEKLNFNLRCGVCKKVFNTLKYNDWSYHQDGRLQDVVTCSDRCQLILLSSTGKTKKN
tara:strand:- start:361 stop:534 length:174 start_codon:yes stop_codon:yes gene_type:complete